MGAIICAFHWKQAFSETSIASMNDFIIAVCVHKPVSGASIVSMEGIIWVMHGHRPL